MPRPSLPEPHSPWLLLLSPLVRRPCALCSMKTPIYLVQTYLEAPPPYLLVAGLLFNILSGERLRHCRQITLV